MHVLIELYGPVTSFAIEYSSAIFSTISAVIISFLMGVHDEKRTYRNVSGSIACGFLTLAITGYLEFFGLPDNAVTFLGAAIGLIGVEKIREKINFVIKSKIKV